MIFLLCNTPHQAASHDLKELTAIGVLREVQAGKEQLFIHRKLMRPHLSKLPHVVVDSALNQPQGVWRDLVWKQARGHGRAHHVHWVVTVWPLTESHVASWRPHRKRQPV